MNFDYSDDQKALKDQARRVLSDKSGPAAVRRILEGSSGFDRSLWQELARLGWLGAAIPECYGGQGLGYVTLCAIAEELGRALAPVPVSSAIYLAAEALLLAGTEVQKKKYLPQIASGECIATLALVENVGPLCRAGISATVGSGRLTGTKLVPDGPGRPNCDRRCARR